MAEMRSGFLGTKMENKYGGNKIRKMDKIIS